MGAPPMDDAPQAGGRAPEAWRAFWTSAVSVGLMGVLAHLAAAPFVFPSLGPTAFLLFHRPRAPAASARSTVGGHLVGTLCGFGALGVFDLIGAPDALSAGVTPARAAAAALSLGATNGLMIALGVVHPPAAATTLIVSLGFMARPDQLVVLMGAVCLLVALARVLQRLAGTPGRGATPVG